MKLHELEEGKVYIGENGEEYTILCGILNYRKCESDFWSITTLVHRYVQDFTPKKVKRTVEERCWINKYPHGLTSYYHKTREEADTRAGANRVACIEMVGTYEVEAEE